MDTREKFEQRIRTQLDVIKETRQDNPAPQYNLLQTTGAMGFQLVEQGMRYSLDLLVHSAQIMIPLWQASLRLSLTGFDVMQNSMRESSSQESQATPARPDEPSATRGIVSFPPPPGRPAYTETQSVATPPTEPPPAAAAPASKAVPPAAAAPTSKAVPPIKRQPAKSAPMTTAVLTPQPPAKQDIAALAPEQSFYFQGPDGNYNITAHNLTEFLRGMDSIDDETWLYHLHRGDYTNWFRHVLHDDELASTTERIAQEQGNMPADSRRQVRAAIQQRYAITL